jgi:isoamylase
LLGGDEFARSQSGHNNAYWQDNELTWFDWSAAAKHADRIEFTAGRCRLRAHSTRCSAATSSSAARRRRNRDDIDWYRPDGAAMTRAGLRVCPPPGPSRSR